MRTVQDRIRHAVSFELIALIIITPAAAWGYDMPIHDIGVVAIVSATIAMVWNYVYNLVFDHAMKRHAGHLRKTPRLRALHAVVFEFGLLLALTPYIAWQLNVGLMQALVMDLSFSAFYLVYAFGFNWAYDVIFPAPDDPATATTSVGRRD